MFARNVSVRLKANSLKQFNEAFEKDVLPILRKQPGFRDEITLVSEDDMHVTAISIWESKEQAESYSTGAYPEVLKTLDKVIDGAPKVRLTKVGNSTMYKPAVVVAAA